MKSFVKATTEFGILVRKKALLEKGLDRAKIIEAADGEQPMDESDELISFGPSFGPEAMDNFGKRLKKLGLEYIDDFFYFHGDFPDWAEFSITLKSSDKI